MASPALTSSAYGRALGQVFRSDSQTGSNVLDSTSTLDSIYGNIHDFLLGHSLLLRDNDNPGEIPLFRSEIILFQTCEGNLLGCGRIESALFQGRQDLDGQCKSW